MKHFFIAYGGLLMREDITNLLPHRDPFLFVDRLTTISEEEIVGFRKFTDKDFFFKGHFPQYAVTPGVILVETMAQCGGAGIRALGKLDESGLFFLASIDNVKFRRQVRPGDEVRMEIKNLRISKKMIKQSGKAFVGGEVAAEAEWLCLVGEAPV